MFFVVNWLTNTWVKWMESKASTILRWITLRKGSWRILNILKQDNTCISWVQSINLYSEYAYTSYRSFHSLSLSDTTTHVWDMVNSISMVQACLWPIHVWGRSGCCKHEVWSVEGSTNETKWSQTREPDSCPCLLPGSNTQYVITSKCFTVLWVLCHPMMSYYSGLDVLPGGPLGSEV